MGQPDYSTEKLAVNQTEPIVDQIVSIGQVDVQLTSLFMGTIHTVVFVEDAKAQQMKALGNRFVTIHYSQKKPMLILSNESMNRN